MVYSIYSTIIYFLLACTSVPLLVVVVLLSGSSTFATSNKINVYVHI